MRIPPDSVIFQWAPLIDYVDPPTRGHALIIVNAIFMTLVVVAVVGRFYSRLFIRKWIGIDDAMCLLAFIFTIGTTTVIVLANVRYHWDRHVWDIPPDMLQPANIIAFVAKLMFTLAATFTRLSLICFYYRLVKDGGIRWFNWVLHASVVWTLGVCIAFVCLTIWLCIPVSYYWIYPQSPTTYGRCLNEGVVMLAGGIINSVSDLLTTILPVPIVMRLQMPLKQRIGVCMLLCLGFVVTIAGAVRTFFTWKSLISSWDETWFSYPLWIAAAVEIDLGMICCCAPAWKTLLQKPIQQLTSKLSSKLSSLRSPSNSPNSSGHAKPAVFNPLRSLPWFQITKLDFERTQRDLEEYSLNRIEKGQAHTTELAVDDHQIECQQDAGARDFRHSELVEESARPSTPALHITMRQSLEQSSTRIDGSPVEPGTWLSDGQSRKLSLRSRT